jgi:5-deoxy-5-amino-3-dehydroquinate synthase
MARDAGRASLEQLRTPELRSALRGYSCDDVDELLRRAIATISDLDAGVKTSAANSITSSELRDTDITETFRGYHRDDVNHLLEAAARTIEYMDAGGHLDAPEEKTESVGTTAAAAIAAEPDPDPDPDDAPDVEPLDTTDPTAEPGYLESLGGYEPVVEPEPAAVASTQPEPVTISVRVSDDGFDRVPVELGDRSYEIVIGPGAASLIGEVLSERGVRRAVIVTQPAIVEHATVIRTQLDGAGVDHETFVIRDGEAMKTIATVDDLCRSFAQWGLLRGDVVIALGGGVVGDTAGFAAAVYHRGVAVIQMPTTLLAMVDSAIGGKTGVNLPQGKNLVGAFHQPIAVLADTEFLATLPIGEFRCGLGEVAKYALMGEPELANLVAATPGGLLARDPGVLRRVVAGSACIKSRYVTVDEHERTGARANLNYGHTLAHAIETVGDHAISHGEAVAVGLVFAGALAGELGRIDSDAASRHLGIVRSLELPTHAPNGMTREELIAVMRRDKKSVGGLTFVLAGPHGLERVDDPDARALEAAFSAVGVRN